MLNSNSMNLFLTTVPKVFEFLKQKRKPYQRTENLL